MSLEKSPLSSGPKIRSYIVTFDGGAAPNPYGEVCTLAVCKPDIRRISQVGDLIIGLTSITLGYQLLYAMYVSEVLPIGDYFLDKRFEGKKPNFRSEDHHDWMGDNFYERALGDAYIQHPSYFNIPGRTLEEFEAKKKTDVVRGKNVLVSDKYWYYGENSKKLPEELDFLRVRRGHRVYGSEGVGKFEKFASHLLKTTGIHGEPRDLNLRASKLAHLHTI